MKALSLYRITWAVTCQAYIAAPALEVALAAWRTQYDQQREPNRVERIANCIDVKGRIFE